MCIRDSIGLCRGCGEKQVHCVQCQQDFGKENVPWDYGGASPGGGSVCGDHSLWLMLQTAIADLSPAVDVDADELVQLPLPFEAARFEEGGKVDEAAVMEWAKKNGGADGWGPKGPTMAVMPTGGMGLRYRLRPGQELLEWVRRKKNDNWGGDRLGGRRRCCA